MYPSGHWIIFYIYCLFDILFLIHNHLLSEINIKTDFTRKSYIFVLVYCMDYRRLLHFSKWSIRVYQPFTNHYCETVDVAWVGKLLISKIALISWTVICLWAFLWTSYIELQNIDEWSQFSILHYEIGIEKKQFVRLQAAMLSKINHIRHP